MAAKPTGYNAADVFDTYNYYLQLRAISQSLAPQSLAHRHPLPIPEKGANVHSPSFVWWLADDMRRTAAAPLRQQYTAD